MDDPGGYVLVFSVGLLIGMGVYSCGTSEIHVSDCEQLCRHRRVADCHRADRKTFAVCAEPEGKFALEIKP